MKFQPRTSSVVLLALTLGGGAAVSLALAPAAAQSAPDDPLVDVVAGGRGRINYAAGVVKATGYGAPPADVATPAQAKLMALGAAKGDALRNLAMAISAVQVTGKTRVENYVLKSDTVETRVQAILQSPRVVSESFQRDGTAVVVVELPLYGEGSVAEAVLPEVLTKKAPQPEPAPVTVAPAPESPEPGGAFKEPERPAVRVAIAPPRIRPLLRRDADPGPTPLSDSGPFTAVIVDCRGLGIQGVLSPKLYDAAGREVYGTIPVDTEFAIETGIVGYPRSMHDALRSKRAGSHPLIVRAQRSFDRHRTDPVISVEDADRVLAADQRDGFLEKTRVIFVVDPVR